MFPEALAELKWDESRYFFFSAATAAQVRRYIPPELMRKLLALRCQLCQVDLLASLQGYEEAKSFSQRSGLRTVVICRACGLKLQAHFGCPQVVLSNPLSKEDMRAVVRFNAEKN